MFQRSLRPIALALVSLAFLTISGMTLFGTFAEPVFVTPLHAAEVVEGNSGSVHPLPPGCINGTPDEGQPLVCCINGFVYFNGQPVRGADVTIQSKHGQQVVVQTDLQLDTERRPYYRQNLSMLTVIPGDTITVTASFSGYTRTLTHTVQSGSQQVDFSLAPTVLGFAGQTQGQAELGKFNHPADIAIDSIGRVYVTDQQNFRVQVFRANGEPQGEWGEYGNLPAQFGSLYGIEIDKRTDTIYIVDRSNQRLLRYTAAGDLLGVWGHAQILTDRPPLNSFDVAVDSGSNVYILSDQGIYKLNAAGEMLYHWDKYGDGGTTWPMTAQHMAVSATGEVYVPDPDKGVVFKFSVTGTPVTLATQLSKPVGVVVDENHHIYVLEAGQLHLSVFDSAGVLVDTLPKQPCQAPDNLTTSLKGITIAGDDIYIAGYDTHRILRINRATGECIPGWGGQARNPGQIAEPYGMEVGKDDALYVADHATGRISKIVNDRVEKSWGPQELGTDANWVPVDIAFANLDLMYVVDNQYKFLRRFRMTGEDFTADGTWDGQTIGAPFCAPTMLDIDKNDVIFMVDSCNTPSGPSGRILALRASTNTLQLLAASNAITGANPLVRPYGIALDDTSSAMTTYLYVSDSATHKVSKYSYTNGVFTFITAWGGPGGALGQFNIPLGVLVDRNHFVYVADQNGRRVQKFDPEGNEPVIYGKNGVGPGNLSYPLGLAMDSRDHLYISETGGSRIQRFAPITNTAPVATIVKLSTTNLRPNESLTAIGLGQDSDATNMIRQYEWSSNRRGVLGRESTLAISASELSSGPHILSLRVQDDDGINNEGTWSDPVSVRIYVMPPIDNLHCKVAAWTMLLYLVGDFQDLGDLQEAFNGVDGVIDRLHLADNPCVNVAVQVDGSTSIGPTGSDTQRWLFKPGQPPQLENIGEQEMDAASTLADFIAWGQRELPADYYYLAIANHGQGILGIGWDHTTDFRRDPPNIQNDTYLTASEIATALADPQVGPIDILHLDACSMSLFDVAYELRALVRYLIASQYMGWSIFAYDQYANLISQTTTTMPADLARSIVNRYADIAKSYPRPHTLSALDLAQADAVKSAFDKLALYLKAWVDQDISSTHERRRQLLALRNTSQLFNSDEDLINTETDFYVDLLDWTRQLTESPVFANTVVFTAATELAALLQGTTNVPPFVLDQRSGTYHLPGGTQPVDLSLAGGVSFYFPLEQFAPPTDVAVAVNEAQPLFSQVYADYITNTSFGLTRASRWDEFLVELLGKPAAGDPLAPPPPPLQTQTTPSMLYLPVVMR